MKQHDESQLIIVNKSPDDLGVQIVIPPFRPINLFEIEDNFEEIKREVESKIYNKAVAERITHFLTAFKEAMDDQDVLPIVEYFIANEIDNLSPDEMKDIFEGMREFIDYINDEDRLMH